MRYANFYGPFQTMSPSHSMVSKHKEICEEIVALIAAMDWWLMTKDILLLLFIFLFINVTLPPQFFSHFNSKT